MGTTICEIGHRERAKGKTVLPVLDGQFQHFRYACNVDAVPGATLPGIYQLRTVAECDAIRQAAQPGARAVVVCMGFIS